MAKQYVAIVGAPIKGYGYEVYGPFDDVEKAVEYGSTCTTLGRTCMCDCWAPELQSPELPDDSPARDSTKEPCVALVGNLQRGFEFLGPLYGFKEAVDGVSEWALPSHAMPIYAEVFRLQEPEAWAEAA